MKVMVVGQGGREHSLVQKFAESANVDQIFAVPGNAGMRALAECVDIDVQDHAALIAFARQKEVDLTLVGPENPLIAGMVDNFQEAGLRVFGPTKDAAFIEGSKHFAKQIMKKYDIPTASYHGFTDLEEAKSYIEEKGAPIVVKADGLAAGKGVVVAETVEEALAAAEEMLEHGQFGEASQEIVVEEFLEGEEFSLMAFVNGPNVYPMLPAKDHKRAFDGDKGPNTGGMGAFAPVPDLRGSSFSYALESIVKPIAEAMVEENRSFTGILYAGLIETVEGPKVIEFNARFGDPETQVVLPLLKNDLDQVIIDVLDGKDPELQWSEEVCAGVVVASEGYPGAYEKGHPLPELGGEEHGFIVHAGIDIDQGRFVSSGGRVLLAGSTGKDLAQALDLTYRSLRSFDGLDNFFYRKDIGRPSIPFSTVRSDVK
ncbi:phosphoribosylamine--glycine ligase [Halobacillus karajensis]|uniref:Phosphoribosylamine--glycine ligase n=1 Tax=Halobacillus karajensis TaxID=195088 RepID=A0A024P553_9BACI|nr:phosphoribosylamine--glycine ligase [Halobacillus karajensis]CDQ20617.1 Phosphoribosylamine--glycine ligase [Halobacillus karajensis]CDQ23913.1 Phosphoribosylamine--glycine ligase [Halobacillus karajensis]CDQ27391.1 Phosphoribosylamine--glycine ligase [Halobacillus karajensis]SEH88674.1 phosphoribosylamine--glycine ligase [Halobacillus karajensis]